MPGKMARSDPRPSFGLPAVLVAVGTSRLSCKRAGKTRTLMPVWDSSGESRLKPPRDIRNKLTAICPKEDSVCYPLGRGKEGTDGATGRSQNDQVCLVGTPC